MPRVGRSFPLQPRGAWRQNLVPPDLTSGLISYWPLDEASSNRADSFDSNPLPPVNAPGNVAGKISTALNVDRPGAKFLSYSGAGLDLTTTDDWSFSCWVNPPDAGGYYTIINAGGDSGGRKIYFFLEQTSGQFYRWDTFASGLNVAAGVWTHVAYTFTSSGTNTGTETAYVNLATATRTGAMYAPATGSLNVGSANTGPSGSQIFSGGIDELGVWRRALSAADVASLYNSGAGLTYPFTGAVATHPFYYSVWRRRAA